MASPDVNINKGVAQTAFHLMHQPFEPPTPPHPGHGGDIHSVWVWKPVKFPDTGQKYWVKSAPLGTRCTNQSLLCRISWTWQPFSFLNPLTRHWRAFLKEENVNSSYPTNLCQMFKLPSLIREEVSLIFRRLQVVRSLLSPGDFEPSKNQTKKASVHLPPGKHKAFPFVARNSPSPPRFSTPPHPSPQLFARHERERWIWGLCLNRTNGKDSRARLRTNFLSITCCGIKGKEII